MKKHRIRLNVSTRNLGKLLIPPIAIKVLKRMLGRNIRFARKYENWEEAAQAARGYDADIIITKVTDSARLVFMGNAIYERDSIIFDEIQYSWPLLASLLLVAATCRHLRVIDFGGALGTTFQQNRKYLNNLSMNCDWRVVEQKKFVEIGEKEFSTQNLTFYDTIGDATLDGVDVVLFAGSICYVSKPYEILMEAIETGATFIIFDRTPITNSAQDTFAVQHIPPFIYKASFPIRNFNYDNLLRPFEADFDLIEKWVCDLQPDPHGSAMGFIFKRRRHEIAGPPRRTGVRGSGFAG